MRRALAITLMLLVLCAPADAEPVDALIGGLDLEALTDWGADLEPQVDVKDLLSELARGESEWELNRALQWVKELALSMAREAAGWVARLAAPALIWAVLSGFWPGGAAHTAQLVCCLAVAAQLIGLYEKCSQLAIKTLHSMGGLCEALYPVLGALLAAGGKGAGSALFTPAAAVAGTLVATGLEQWALGMTGIAAVLTVAGHLSDKLRLDGLAGLARKACAFFLGGMMTVFAGVMTVQGILSRGYDGASLQTARFAVGSLLPIVGGEVADSLDALVTSASLVRNAVGVTGLILLLAACARPVIYLGLMSLAAKLASAAVEIVSAGVPQKLIARFSEVLSLLLAAVAAGAVLVMILIGAALALFTGG